MLRRSKRMLVVAAVMVASASEARMALAWSESGHHLICLLAFAELKPAEREELLGILQAHPRYAEDFTPAEKIQNRDRFRIGTAGYWPDIARKLPKYNRPTWHYQLGASLTLGDVSLLRVPEPPGPLPPDATLETKELYIAQAVKLCRTVLCDKSAAPSDRAIALCWIGHLVADAHQPCHAGSLYAVGLFPDGDRGANSIATRQKNNMHALWDGLLGGRYSEGAINRREQEFQGGPAYAVLRSEVFSRPDTLDPLTWLSESQKTARDYVYTREVLFLTEAVMKEGGELPVIYFSEEYLQRAGGVAQVRAAEAGHRLATIWRQGLSAKDR